jgi:hypothetical protein
MAEPVELGSHLADLGRHEVVMPDGVAGADRPAAGRAAGMRSTNWRVPNSGISALYSWPSL